MAQSGRKKGALGMHGRVVRRSPIKSVGEVIPAADRRARFVAEYLQTYNATQSAIAAGYSPRTAYSAGSRLLRHVEVQEALAAHRDRAFAATEMTAAEVLRGLAAQARSNIDHFIDLDERGRPILNLAKATPAQRAALRSVKVQEREETDSEGRVTASTRSTDIRVADPRPALVDLGRHLGLFSDAGERPASVTFVIERTSISAHIRPHGD